MYNTTCDRHSSLTFGFGIITRYVCLFLDEVKQHNANAGRVRIVIRLTVSLVNDQKTANLVGSGADSLL
jgi:hypothetical protein